MRLSFEKVKCIRGTYHYIYVVCDTCFGLIPSEFETSHGGDAWEGVLSEVFRIAVVGEVTDVERQTKMIVEHERGMGVEAAGILAGVLTGEVLGDFGAVSGL